MDDFEFVPAIDEEFRTLIDLAWEVAEGTTISDLTQMAADAAAVASFRSFGFGMAFFAGLEVMDKVEKYVISTKSDQLNAKLRTVDSDIASNINKDVQTYIEKFKENNRIIYAQAPKDENIRHCRSNLFLFMSQIWRKEGKITASIFRQYAASVKEVFDSKEIVDVYDALDGLNVSERKEADVKKLLNTLVGLGLSKSAEKGIEVVQGISITIMRNKMKIAIKTIAELARSSGISVAQVGKSAFVLMDAVGKFASGIAFAVSAIDFFLEFMDICHVVEQYQKMRDELQGRIKESYISFYRDIQEACKKYKKAIGADGTEVVPASSDKKKECCVVF